MTFLEPDPQRGRRLLAFALHVVIVVASPFGWWLKFPALVLGAFLLGSYRQAWLVEGRFTRQFVSFFVPLPLKSWPLERFRAIETRHTQEAGVESSLVGASEWHLWKLLDWMAPWHFGNTRLRLRLDNGKRVLVWQGMSDANYEANLAILKETTGLPVAAPNGTISDAEWEQQQEPASAE